MHSLIPNTRHLAHPNFTCVLGGLLFYRNERVGCSIFCCSLTHTVKRNKTRIRVFNRSCQQLYYTILCDFSLSRKHLQWRVTGEEHLATQGRS